MNVIIDFDNTFFTPYRDVDDGLALLYLLGSPEVNVVAVTTCFGNKDIETVDQDTVRLLRELDLGVPYAQGASECGDYLNPASRLIADTVAQYAGDIAILATGSMTNLQGAYLYNPELFHQCHQVVLMGGTTEPLIFQKQEMLELNLSCDPQASYCVLTKARKLSIMTGNNCLDLLFTKERYNELFRGHNSQLVKLIEAKSEVWFQANEDEYGIEGYYNWDSLAAAYLVNPHFFKDQQQDCMVSVEGLSRGELHSVNRDQTSYSPSKPYQQVRLNLPKIEDKSGLEQNMYQTWMNVEAELSRK